MRYTKLLRVLAASFILTIMAAYGVTACGGGLDSCPGIVCTDCGASGDCNAQCSAGEFNYCGHFGFFEDLSLRCNFCDSSDDPFASQVPTGP